MSNSSQSLRAIVPLGCVSVLGLGAVVYLLKQRRDLQAALHNAKRSLTEMQEEMARAPRPPTPRAAPEVLPSPKKITETFAETVDTAAALQAVLESTAEERLGQICLYDLETTIPQDDIIEFGAIIIDAVSFKELASYQTLIYSTKVTKRSTECNHITQDMLNPAPQWADVANTIFRLMDGRIWAGHNIIKFDNPVIDVHFAGKLKRPPPVPRGVIDTLPLLSDTFGKRAGGMKMAQLGRYFHLGEEEHRSIEDCRMTFHVLAMSALTLFLEKNCSDALNGATTGRIVEAAKPAAKAPAAKAKKKAPAAPAEEKAPNDAHIAMLQHGMDNRATLWMTYQGGANPLALREIRPICWQRDDHSLFLAFCVASQKDKSWCTGKIARLEMEPFQAAGQAAPPP